MPSRVSDCELTYERVAPTDAQPQWRQVGQVWVEREIQFESSGSTLFDMVYQPGEMHDVLAAKACAFGGEMVAPDPGIAPTDCSTRSPSAFTSDSESGPAPARTARQPARGT